MRAYWSVGRHGQIRMFPFMYLRHTGQVVNHLLSLMKLIVHLGCQMDYG